MRQRLLEMHSVHLVLVMASSWFSEGSRINSEVVHWAGASLAAFVLSHTPTSCLRENRESLSGQDRELIRTGGSKVELHRRCFQNSLSSHYWRSSSNSSNRSDSSGRGSCSRSRFSSDQLCKVTREHASGTLIFAGPPTRRILDRYINDSTHREGKLSGLLGGVIKDRFCLKSRGSCRNSDGCERRRSRRCCRSCERRSPRRRQAPSAVSIP
mmetsp:Transcript_7268/g.22315  ORF Transcript_7268/g.22315 Transcript_7268/m.22315 type:complete len:212 (-) Transcript_7268:1276-1911(-)